MAIMSTPHFANPLAKTPAPKMIGIARLGMNLCVGLGVGMVALGTALPAMAQLGPAISTGTGTADALKDPLRPENDLFSNRGDRTNGIFDLMHRAVLGPGKSLDEFNAEQAESLDAATAAFRTQQQQQLKGQPAAAPATVAPQPTTIAPSAQ
jgi:hypothetical protein